MTKKPLLAQINEHLSTLPEVKDCPNNTAILLAYAANHIKILEELDEMQLAFKILKATEDSDKSMARQYAERIYSELSNYVGTDHEKHCIDYLCFFIGSMESEIEKAQTIDPTSVTLNPIGFTEEAVETALCVWEVAINSNIGNNVGEHSPLVKWLQQGEGACNARSNAIKVAAFVDVAYEACAGEYHDAFDWEFVPSVLWYFIENTKAPSDIPTELAYAAGRIILDRTKR